MHKNRKKNIPRRLLHHLLHDTNSIEQVVTLMARCRTSSVMSRNMTHGVNEGVMENHIKDT